MTTYFQNCGVIAGFVSYPFYVDGKDLYKDVFKKHFFVKYKNGINKYSDEDLPEHLYNPRGYRLFGNYGLVILSLIDDFAFGDRIFHSNHAYLEKDSPLIYEHQYTCKAIMGVVDTEEKNEDYLLNKARQTFLKEQNQTGEVNSTSGRYPFIGITKLKVDYYLLYGRGIYLTREIKKKIGEVVKEACDPEKGELIDFIVLDCFDNDELTVVAFSNSIVSINSFFSCIRNFTCEDLNITLPDEEYVPGKHIFSSCYTNVGYDIDYQFDKGKEDNQMFMEPKDVDKLRLKLIWEPKIGHGEYCRKNLPEWLKVQEEQEEDPVLEPSLTGGNALSQSYSLKNIHRLEKKCSGKEQSQHEDECPGEQIRANIRRVKITLCWSEKEYSTLEREELEILPPVVKSTNEPLFNQVYLERIRNLLNECRISKIARERLLKIYGLFNEHSRDRLHAGYFWELHDALCSVERMLQDFKQSKRKKIGEIDHILSEMITSLEEACYNRYYQKEYQDTNLEYNGGVQQHLSSIDFVYKNILKLFHPPLSKKDSNASFVSISGYEKVTSTRNNLRLNINQITYPELFAISVWKEAANFSFSFFRKGERISGNDSAEYEYQKKVTTWKKFIENKSCFIDIRAILENQEYFVDYDEVYTTISKLMNKETVEYLFVDAQSFHFGFHRNYELFNHFYWKYFLQISQYYDRNGRIDMEYFISYLLRLFMVGFRKNRYWNKPNPTQDGIDFIKKRRFIPFDPVLSEMWFLCYEKVYKCACTIWEELNKFEFEYITEVEIHQIEMDSGDPALLKEKMEHVLTDKESFVPANSRVIESRKRYIQYLKGKIREKALCDLFPDDRVLDINEIPTDWTPNYLISLLNAYLLASYELDVSKGVAETKAIRSIPRGSKGEILLEERAEGQTSEDELKKRLTNLPVDPLGGFFISNYKTRGDYFAYRSCFYRSLWHYTMVNRDRGIVSRNSK